METLTFTYKESSKLLEILRSYCKLRKQFELFHFQVVPDRNRSFINLLSQF